MIRVLKNIYIFLFKLWKKTQLFFSVNWIKTVYFNFKMLPFDQAMKLPFYFYGSVKFTSLKGTVKIEAPVKKGMIGFGQRFEKMSRAKGIGEVILKGNLVFKGHAHFGKDVFLCVEENGYCEFGFMGCLGSDVMLLCTNKIIIGDWAGIAYQSQVIDTNSHPMMNSNSGEHYPISGEIKIGNHNSISNRVTIMANTITPDNCVVASNSLCNKDYSQLGENILLGGVPAKLIKKDYNRDWESEKEMLMRYKRVKL
ncbi:transferase [Psychroserpens sp. XS_ASV72]|uniref:acyltransferase n=1 Tax=Psychroserpens sp. XS_ASV72 TaxID=3241293 RepID=UPI0035199F6C